MCILCEKSSFYNVSVKITSEDMDEVLGRKMQEALREIRHIKGLIQKLQSLKAILQYNKDNASKELNTFVEKMYEHLVMFR